MLGRNIPSSQGPARHSESFGVWSSKTYQKSDEVLRADVCETLLRDTVVDASDIEVEVIEGEVTFRGTVSNRHEKYHAEEIIAHLAGVKSIQNQLRVLRSAYEEEGDQGFDARRW